MSTGESLKLGLELDLCSGDFQLHAKDVDIGPNCNPSAMLATQTLIHTHSNLEFAT